MCHGWVFVVNVVVSTLVAKVVFDFIGDFLGTRGSTPGRQPFRGDLARGWFVGTSVHARVVVVVLRRPGRSAIVVFFLVNVVVLKFVAVMGQGVIGKFFVAGRSATRGAQHFLGGLAIGRCVRAAVRAVGFWRVAPLPATLRVIDFHGIRIYDELQPLMCTVMIL